MREGNPNDSPRPGARPGARRRGSTDAGRPSSRAADAGDGTAAARSPGFRNPRSLVLAELSILVLAAYCNLPPERMWFNHLVQYCGQVGAQMHDCTPDHRMREQLRENYTIPRQIAARLQPGDVFLLPPVAYARASLGEEACVWVEPKYFYYMAGPLRTVTAHSPRAREATCSILLEPGGQWRLLRFSCADDLERTLQTFLRYEP